MNQTVRPFDLGLFQAEESFCLQVVGRDKLAKLPRWKRAFADKRKDHRYYELVEATLHPEFEYHSFVLRDSCGEVRAIEPFFVLEQDMLAGTIGHFSALAGKIRRLWPSFLRIRTLMVGCVAGEGHLDGGE